MIHGVPLCPRSTSDLYSDYIKNDNDDLNSSSGSYPIHYGDENVDSTSDQTQHEREHGKAALADEVAMADAYEKLK